MQASAFQDHSPGRLIDNFDRRLTFVPDPLPPRLQLSPKLIQAISEVSNLLGRLDGIARTLPDPSVLIRSFVRREAQLSSYIENTYARYEEVAEAESDQSSVSEQVRETYNAEQSILVGLKMLQMRNAPISNALIRQLHEMLMKGVRGHETRGQVRDKQVNIRSRELGIEHARFVPPPPHLVSDLMQQFEAYMTGDDDMPILIRLGLLHYQFEAIHPFEDGNGRLGRTLILLGLCRHELLSVPILNASLHFERNRQIYYDRLLRVSTHGDWNGWLEFFVTGLRVAAVESEAKLRELLELQRQYHDLIRSARNAAWMLTLVDHLFIRPIVTIPMVAQRIGVSYPTAKNGVRKLLAAGILEPVAGSTPARFVARRILTALNAEPSPR